MGARGSALSRAVSFFRSASLDEARAAKIIVDEVMAKRMRDENVPVPEIHKKPRARRKHPGEPAPHASERENPRQMTVEEGIARATTVAASGADLG